MDAPGPPTRLRCPRCATTVTAAPGSLARCPGCGFTARAPAAPPPAPPRPPPRPLPAPPAPAPAASAPWAPPAWGAWRAVPGAVEPDVFWGHAAAPRIPRVESRAFYPLPAPPLRAGFLTRTAERRALLAAVLFGAGFFSVFVRQAGFLSFDVVLGSAVGLLYQLVLGAPIFEEFVKFGLALALVAWLPPGRGAGRLLSSALRMVAAWGVGAGFGLLEHHVTYGDETRALFVGRLLFHAGATGLSMAAFIVLEAAAEARVRWLSTLPATVLHFANNAMAIPLGIAGAVAGSDAVPLAWSAACTLLTYVATAAMAVAGGRFRSFALRQVRLRLRREPVRAAVPATGPAPGA